MIPAIQSIRTAAGIATTTTKSTDTHIVTATMSLMTIRMHTIMLIHMTTVTGIMNTRTVIMGMRRTEG